VDAFFAVKEEILQIMSENGPIKRPVVKGEDEG